MLVNEEINNRYAESQGGTIMAIAQDILSLINNNQDMESFQQLSHEMGGEVTAYNAPGGSGVVAALTVPRVQRSR